MFEHRGIWLPDGEHHFVEWIDRSPLRNGRGTYQINKLDEAMRWVKKFDFAVDVGAHVGLWTMHLAMLFKTVHSFEPMLNLRACFEKNISDEHRGRVQLHAEALGNQKKQVTMQYVSDHSGNSRIDKNGDTPGVIMTTLDSMKFQALDFLKLDCEGYEQFVLRGGVKTLLRFKPCIVVEQKPNQAQRYNLTERGAVDYLVTELGAVLRRSMNGDFILSWDEK